MGMVTSTMLDANASYEMLGKTTAIRLQAYEKFVHAGINENELKLISSAVKRNQLTGNAQFTSEIAEKIGRRIELREPGRPLKNEN